MSSATERSLLFFSQLGERRLVFLLTAEPLMKNRFRNAPELPFPQRGGRRLGAGRKRLADRPRVSHRARERHGARHPLLVTVRLQRALPSLRRKREFTLIRTRIDAANGRFGMRVVHYSVQSNHVHLIVEAPDQLALARGMKGVLVRIARALNDAWDRRGSVFDDHYHARALKTPREVRNALVYVLQNARKHGVQLAGLDPFSSASAFDGWKAGGRSERSTRARTWLLSVGWRRHGLIAITERPARECRSSVVRRRDVSPFEMHAHRARGRQR
jgi:REP element-mobilizing transposase RayT